MTKTFNADYYSWTKEQADALKRRSANELDWDRLAEEMDALGASEERELNSRYVVLLTHLLKWIYQPERRGRSWSLTIVEQRAQIARHLGRNPGLKGHDAEEFSIAYASARRTAAIETDLDLETFPEAPPFTMDQAKDEAWMPE
jgi:hypothetical protein